MRYMRYDCTCNGEPRARNILCEYDVMFLTYVEWNSGFPHRAIFRLVCLDRFGLVEDQEHTNNIDLGLRSMQRKSHLDFPRVETTCSLSVTDWK